MKVAITYENESVFQHFGHTEKVKVYTIEDNNIVSSEVISTEGNGHSDLVNFLKKLGIDVLICGGIGKGAKDALKEAGIELYGGVSGNVDLAITDFINGTLKYNENVECSHHKDENHNCSDEHTCKSHKKYNGITVLTNENFEEEVKNCDDLVVIDFWAVWCGPCQMLSPIIDELSEEINDVKFGKVNVDEQQELAMQFNVRSIPTVAFIKNGDVVDLSIGYVSKEELTERIEKNK